MSMRLRKAGAVLAMLLALALAAGCGGGGGSDAPALTKAEFIRRADAICAKSERVKTREVENFYLRHPRGANGTVSKAQQEELIVDASLPPTRAAIEQVGELGIPEGDEEEVESILAETEEAIARLESEPRLMVTGSVNVYEAVQKRARAYGFKSCIIYL